MKPATNVTDDRLNRLTENADVVMMRYRLGSPAGIDFVSPSARHILGYEPEEFYERPELGLEIVHPEDRDRLLGEYARDPEAPFLGRAVHKDGSVRWFVRRQTVVPDEHGQPAFLESTLRDITPQVEATEALAVSERQWHAVFASARDVFLLIDDKRVVTGANPAAAEFFNAPIDKLVGRRIDGFGAPEDLDERWERLMRNGSARGESAWRLPDGSERVVEISATANVAPGRHLAVVRDITEERAAKEALHESQMRFRTAFEHAPIGMALVGTDGSWLEVNRAFCEFLGYSEEELYATTWQALTYPEDLDADQASVDAALAGEIDGYTMEKRYVRKDRAVVRGRLSVALVRTPAGEPRYFISQLEDIDELRRLLEERRQGKRLESLGRLSAGIAHDFNNMLTAISGYAALCLSRPLDEKTRADLLDIQAAAARASGLTSQLLAFGRRQILDPDLHEVNEIVESVESLLRRVLGERIELVTALCTDSTRVRVDSGQLEQALVNLVVNARDAMPAGGQIVIETNRNDGHVALSVSDTGSGIDDEAREHIFDPFFTTKESGSGLGLASVYGFVRQSGGRVDVQSALGQGSTFTLYLPALD